MSENEEQEKRNPQWITKYELPHVAKYDLGRKIVEYPIGPFTLKLSIEEFLSFFMEFQDVAFAVQSLTEVDASICQVCGHVEEEFVFNPEKPSDA